MIRLNYCRVNIKLDTEQAVATAQRFGIRSIPTLMVFRGGEILGQQAGALSATAFAQWLAKLGVRSS